jgi:hypothetical protein
MPQPACPKCQGQARQRWLAAREREVPGVPYFHVVSTVPHELNPLCQYNPTVLDNLLFQSTAAALLEVAADPQHLGAQIGCLSILHTWGQNLLHHPHLHCAIPAGGFSPDHKRRVHPRYAFFLPVKALSRAFRGKFIAGLRRAYRRKKLRFHGSTAALEDPRRFAIFLRTAFRQDWVVYAKPAFGGRLKYSVISAGTRIGLRSAIIGCWRLTASASPSAGRITRTAVNSGK